MEPPRFMGPSQNGKNLNSYPKHKNETGFGAQSQPISELEAGVDGETTSQILRRGAECQRAGGAQVSAGLLEAALRSNWVEIPEKQQNFGSQMGDGIIEVKCHGSFTCLPPSLSLSLSLSLSPSLHLSFFLPHHPSTHLSII